VIHTLLREKHRWSLFSPHWCFMRALRHRRTE
jgi:hypothetical protein